ncbi:hypothetical protein JXB11_01415 [Candidatus Woesearchaeota archaeon]|nr:hypothetical protein [Candidatus Woesearchaeota archaeon]
MSDADYQEKLSNLVETLKKTGLAASTEDAIEIAKRMLTKRDIEKGPKVSE